jgi:hypothetical protein
MGEPISGPAASPAESSETIRAHVQGSPEVQRARFAQDGLRRAASQRMFHPTKRHCQLDGTAESMTELQLSGPRPTIRYPQRSLATIADLAKSDKYRRPTTSAKP